jgi:glycosyltransferase involved in cell wall biosynthesis
MHPLHVAIDTKNLALYSGGIAGFLRPLIAGWISQRPDIEFSLVGPAFDTSFLPKRENWSHRTISWPEGLPRKLRHPVYDNVIFPRAISSLKAGLVFSPYHDVLLPPPNRSTSVMTIHDVCIDELGDLYPTVYRQYMLTMLRRNLKRAAHVVTVSEASRAKIIERYSVAPCAVTVISNAVPKEMIEQRTDPGKIEAIRRHYGSAWLILYPGGCEHRKNVGRLVNALGALLAKGVDCHLLVTGTSNECWRRALAASTDRLTFDRVRFLGNLTTASLSDFYAAVDAVVYPTLCEGFGRVCLEAMYTGAPLACSDLPVLREIAGDGAEYFNPYDSGEIAAAIRRAVESGRRQPRLDTRYKSETVVSRFVTLMDALLDGSRGADVTRNQARDA